MHDAAAASEWVRRWAHLVPAQGLVLDVACGSGRHLRHFHEQGHAVTGIDRNPEALTAAKALVPEAELINADIENGPWPCAHRQFTGVVVTNYLWRPLLPRIVESIAPGGALIYETFAVGNEKFGKPSNPDFLLRPGELLEACKALRKDARVVAYEDVTLNAPPRCVQRIAALFEPSKMADSQKLMTQT
jgi:SAM-dependent methyltransferase